MNRQSLEDAFVLERELRVRASRESFWEYCKTMYPEFYKEDRWHLRKIADAMQDLYEGNLINPRTGKKYKKMILSVPPRHGKTFTRDNFICWLFGKNPEKTKVLAASYSKSLSLISSRTIRNQLKQERVDPLQITYEDIFPHTKLSDDNAAVEQWSVEGSYFSFKATSVGSSVTGMGASVLLADDLVADSFVANNPNELDKIQDWLMNTFSSRIESGDNSNAITMIVGTMWSDNDHIGRILKSEDADEYYVIRMAAYNKDTDEMLCPALLSREQYEYLKRNMDFGIFMANYMAETVDDKDKLYENLLEAHTIPSVKETICVVDPADTGSDSFSAIIADVGVDGKGYIKDILFTKKDMDYTQEELARILTEHKVRRCKIEANAAGRLFSKNVEGILRNKYNNVFTTIQLFHQTKNKESRIFTHAHVLQKEVYFPLNWRTRFPDFYTEMNTYKRNAKNAHDDAPDSATILVEELLRLKGRNNNLTASMLGI